MTALQELARALEAAAAAVRRLDAEGLVARGDAPPPPVAYTVASLAAALGRSPSTIRGWVEDGRLGARKVGRGWLIPADAVDRLFAGVQGRPGGRIAARPETRLPPRRPRASATADQPDLGAWRRLQTGGAP